MAPPGHLSNVLRRVRRARTRMLTFALLAAAAACTQEVERIPEIYRPTNAHEAYRHGLVQTNLSGAAIGRDWMAAADAALSSPVRITLPFEETGYFDEAEATAMGYVFSVTRGQRVDAELQIHSREPIQIFVDLFRLVDDDRQAPVHVATGATMIEPPEDSTGAPVAAPEAHRRLDIEPLRDGVYVLRVQPELLRSVRYTVRVTADASLGFPVADHSTASIQSFFGAERDGGRRSHHGVDIFAPRGTPVLAASDGVVTRANTTPVGGNIVWVSDARRNMRLYYAHMDSHAVERGQRVRAGDVLGTVGNTGNAITTPPHLHFGVYARGPVDPVPFLERLRTDPVEISVDVAKLGTWSRTASGAIDVLAAPDRRADVLGSVGQHTPLYLSGASARWYRVALPDGGSGYVAGTATEAVTPLRNTAVVGTAPVLDRPDTWSDVIEHLSPGVEVPVLGAFRDFLYVQTPAGLNGWLSLD